MNFEFPAPNQEKTTTEEEMTLETINDEIENIEIKPEDKNEKGQLLASPDGPISNLPEFEWKMVRTPSFKKWFGESVVVDENNEPLICYHGSKEKFSKFNLKKAGTNKDSGFFGKGFYFTPRKELAEKYGQIMYKTFLRIEHVQIFSEESGNVRFFEPEALPENIREEVMRRYNPLKEKEFQRLTEEEEKHKNDWGYIPTWNGENKFEYILSDLIREVLLEKGYDGVFGFNKISNLYEYVAFNENDILIIPE